MCFECWKKSNPPKGKGSQYKITPLDEACALQENATDLISGTIYHSRNDTEQMNYCSLESSALQNKGFMLNRHIFDYQKGWTRAESMQHQTLCLRLSVGKEDYKHTGLSCPNVQPSNFMVVSRDTGAVSCFWSGKDFLRCFQLSDLAPIKCTIVAANRVEIAIDGPLLVKLSGSDVMGKHPHSSSHGICEL